MIGLTKKQQAVYDAIRKCLDAGEAPPTLKELGERFGVTNVTVLGHIEALIRKGVVCRHGHGNRNIRLVGQCPLCGRPLEQGND